MRKANSSPSASVKGKEKVIDESEKGKDNEKYLKAKALVREFYGSIKVENEDAFTVKLKGKTYRISKNDLAMAYGILDEGTLEGRSSKWMTTVTKEKGLPYDMVFTTLFEYLDIDLKEEYEIKLKKSHCINHRFLQYSMQRGKNNEEVEIEKEKERQEGDKIEEFEFDNEKDSSEESEKSESNEEESEKEESSENEEENRNFSRWEDYPSEKSHKEGMQSEEEVDLDGLMREIQQEDKKTDGRNKLIQALNNVANQISSAAKIFAKAVSELKSLR
ncbi:calponin homology domain-containing protein DDB_G0272472-like [Jatropha curcas]|uniref:calponin homology domain-containing protein DDB_G0272472-like n=1 Tax=Jatropha curcas TaxID=180498 RepID=UPI0005FB1F4A|nr:calponin homology domain-containing protein DDB_G0272472-like [Jatropha curcas]